MLLGDNEARLHPRAIVIRLIADQLVVSGLQGEAQRLLLAGLEVGCLAEVCDLGSFTRLFFLS